MFERRHLWSGLTATILFMLIAGLVPFFAEQRTTALGSTPSETPTRQTQVAQQRSPTPTRQQAVTRTPTPTVNPTRAQQVAATVTAFAPNAPVDATLATALTIDGGFAQGILTPDLKRFLVRTVNGRVFVYDVADGQGVLRLTLEHGERTHGMILSPDGQRLASWNDAQTNCTDCAQMRVRIWNLADGSLINELGIPDETRFLSRNGVRWNRDGTRLLTWSRRGEVEVWDAASGQNVLRMRHNTIVWGAAWNSDETRLLTWTTGQGVRIYDALTGELRYSLGHLAAILNAMWSQDGRRILTGGFDGFAGFWDGVNGAPLNLYYHADYRPGRSNPEAELWAIAWSGDEKRVFTGSLAGKVHLWNASATTTFVGQKVLNPLAVLNIGSAVTRMAANTDGSRVFVRARDTLLWNPDSNALVLQIPDDGAPNPSMDMLAVWNDYGVTLHSTADGAILARLTQPSAVRGAQWLSDNALLTWSDTGEVRLWQGVRRRRSDAAHTLAASLTPPPNPSPTYIAAMSTGISTGRRQLGRATVSGQVFTNTKQQIQTIEVEVSGGSAFQEAQLTLEVKTLDGEVLGRQEQSLPPGEPRWLAFVFDPPLPAQPGQQYRIELSGGAGVAHWSVSQDGYPQGVMYTTNVDNSWTSYEIHTDFRFRVDVSSSVEIAPQQTIIAQQLTHVPATQTVAAMTLTPRHLTQVAPITATAANIATKAAALGVSPDVARGLFIGTEASLTDKFALQPGERLNFKVGVMECCYMFVPASIKTRWLISPAAGASIDPESGAFSVGQSTPHGTVYTVTATLADGAVQLSTQVHVYTLQGNPLVGAWREEAQLTCTPGDPVQPRQPIGELIFRADGTFSVTWMPFEVYYDYQGTYEFNVNSGLLTLNARMVNYLPGDLAPSGTFSIDPQGRLVLQQIWLGRPPTGESAERHCGHRFVRQSSYGR